MRLAFRDHAVGRQVTIMIEQQMQFHGPLGLTKLCPIEDRQAQINDRGIQAVELVLEAELARRRQPLATRQQPVKDPLKEFRRPMTVGIREGRTLRRGPHAQVIESPFDTGQTPANLAQAVGTA